MIHCSVRIIGKTDVCALECWNANQHYAGNPSYCTFHSQGVRVLHWFEEYFPWPSGIQNIDFQKIEDDRVSISYNYIHNERNDPTFSLNNALWQKTINNLPFYFSFRTFSLLIVSGVWSLVHYCKLMGKHHRYKNI